MHIISKAWISMDLTEVQAVVEWSQPKMVTENKSFLGLTGYYKRFNKEFSLVELPMIKLIRKWVKFLWDDKCERRF